jgi:hypothetical protein
VEPTDPTSESTDTPDDWTPWATPDPADEATADDQPGDDGVATVAPVVSARARRLAQGNTAAPTRRSRRAGALTSASSPIARARAVVSVGGIVAAIGGAVAIAGTLLELLSVGIGVNALNTVTLSTTYFDTDDGKVVAAVAAAALIVALIALVKPMSSIIPSIVVAACGLAVFGFALYNRIDLDSQTDDLRRQLTRNNPYKGLVHVSIGPAVYVAMAGGILATIGAVMASRDR